ncbi:hypothetical protein ACT4R9_11280 [Ornithobacterium rhinotracheale]|uniref:hypothetical protein n=1 Tax=Ornithobacterium rhinotracheale TaxID=28251 RepID=UPI001FF47734|nr:hypothetical protein [Ornithobacterium rhinotracheale]MCK0206183.1 hypothetical protein [Ornithobacterium rhinotracheale]
MATIEVINYCNEHLLKGWKKVGTGEPSKLDLNFLGISVKVKQSELQGMSEAEKQRHINEDILILSVYGYREAKTPRRLRAEIIATENNIPVSAELLAEGL